MASRIADGSEVYWDGRHYDAFNQPYQDDLKFYLAEARKARGPVLELACGTGRLTIPLRKKGVDITGLDLAAPMLEVARAIPPEEKIQACFYGLQFPAAPG
jgi:2-polyprenyl-3-methyl-5-hydroxy-6-metoxy-1,4-benzoquinol methylase